MKEERPSAFFDASQLGLTLVRAGRDEWPSDDALSRTLTAVGAGAAVVAVTTGATAGASAGAKGGAALIGFGSVVKWLGMGAAGGAVVAGIAHGVSAPPPLRVSNTVVTSPARPADGALTSPDEPRERARSVPEPEAAPTSEPVTPAPKQAVAPSVSRGSDDEERGVPLAAEVALVDRARGALASGDPARTLRELERYEALFPDRRLAPEVLYLRMEAHVAAGHDALARETAERSVRLFPRSPHAARARSILEKGEGGPK
jgi:hypothetical protein